MNTSSKFLKRQLADGILNGNGYALDLGCGRGVDALFLARRGYRVEAVEKNATHTSTLDELARNHNPTVQVFHQKIEEFEITRQNYSLIIARNSLSFISDSATVMRVVGDMVHGLKPEGMLCFTLFGNRDGWSRRTDMSFFEYEAIVTALEDLPVSVYYR